MDYFSIACSTLAIIISLMKTTLMYQFPRGKANSESSNYVYGQKFQVVEKIRGFRQYCKRDK